MFSKGPKIVRHVNKVLKQNKLNNDLRSSARKHYTDTKHGCGKCFHKLCQKQDNLFFTFS